MTQTSLDRGAYWTTTDTNTDTTADETDTVTVDVTALETDPIFPPGANISAATYASLSGTVRVRLPPHHRKRVLEMVILARRVVCRQFREHPDDFDAASHPDAYQAVRDRLATAEGDTVVLTARHLQTLWDAVVTWRMDLDKPSSTHTEYLMATLSRAEAALLRQTRGT